MRDGLRSSVRNDPALRGPDRRDPAFRDLAERACSGDRAALATLWNAHRRFLASILRAHAISGSDLDDLVQEVAVRVVASIQDLNDPSAFRSWLRQIAINVARSDGRSSRRASEVLRQDPPLEPIDPRSLGQREASEWLQEVEVLLTTLKAQDRELLLLRSADGLSQQELAELFGCTEHAVESRLVRIRQQLRRGIAGRAGQPTVSDRRTVPDGARRPERHQERRHD